MGKIIKFEKIKARQGKYSLVIFQKETRELITVITFNEIPSEKIKQIVCDKRFDYIIAKTDETILEDINGHLYVKI